MSTLSDSDRTLYAARLTEAETALHSILTGGNTQRIRHGDRDISFNQTNIADLRAYISELRSILGLDSAPFTQLNRTMWRRPRWGM